MDKKILQLHPISYLKTSRMTSIRMAKDVLTNADPNKLRVNSVLRKKTVKKTQHSH